jgi:hypothetical protein
MSGLTHPPDCRPWPEEIETFVRRPDPPQPGVFMRRAPQVRRVSGGRRPRYEIEPSPQPRDRPVRVTRCRRCGATHYEEITE